MRGLSVLIVFLLLGLSSCRGYKILAVFPFYGKSHWNVLLPITKALAAKGHQVDVVSHFPLDYELPNYTDVVKLPNVGKPGAVSYQFFNSRENYMRTSVKVITEMCEYLQLPGLSELIKNEQRNTTYDLLLIHVRCCY